MRTLLAITLLAAFFPLTGHSQEFTGRDPETGQILSPGAATGQYLQYSSNIRLRVQQLRTALDLCGDCSNRSQIASDYELASQKLNNMVRGEGIALKSLGLPEKSFGEFWDDLRFGRQRRPPAGLLFDAQLTRLIRNYCTLTASQSTASEDACPRQVESGDPRTLATKTPSVCYDKINNEGGVQLHHFPPPDADPAVIVKHEVLWAKFEACLKETSPFERIRLATNKACLFKDLSPNLDPAQFLCACKAIPREKRGACPAKLTLPEPTILSFWLDEPVKRMFELGGYGPSVMGIKLGESTLKADREIRRRMHVESVYDLLNSNEYSFHSEIRVFRNGFSGRLYVNDDDTEYVAIMAMPANLPGRVSKVVHLRLAEDGQKAIRNALVQEAGPPISEITNTTGVWDRGHRHVTPVKSPRIDYWGNGRNSPCLAETHANPPIENWHRVEGKGSLFHTAAAVGPAKRQMTISGGILPMLQHPGLPMPRSPGGFGASTAPKSPVTQTPATPKSGMNDLLPMDETNRLGADETYYNCRPGIKLVYSIGNDGMPVFSRTELYDPAILRWYEIQERDRDPPVALNYGSSIQ